MRINRRGAIAIEYALVSALLGVAIIASIFYLQRSTDSYFKSWGGTASTKVQTKNVIAHHKGITTNTGAPTNTGGSNLMNQLANFEGNVAIVAPKPSPQPVQPTPVPPKPIDNKPIDVVVGQPVGSGPSLVSGTSGSDKGTTSGSGTGANSGSGTGTTSGSGTSSTGSTGTTVVDKKTTTTQDDLLNKDAQVVNTSGGTSTGTTTNTSSGGAGGGGGQTSKGGGHQLDANHLNAMK